MVKTTVLAGLITVAASLISSGLIIVVHNEAPASLVLYAVLVSLFLWQHIRGAQWARWALVAVAVLFVATHGPGFREVLTNPDAILFFLFGWIQLLASLALVISVVMDTYDRSTR